MHYFVNTFSQKKILVALVPQRQEKIYLGRGENKLLSVHTAGRKKYRNS